MKKIILLTGIILPIALFGQLDRSKQPQPQKAPAINIKDSEVFTTANGITVILSENHKLPTVSFDLFMGSDPISEGAKAGLSEFAGSMIMSGTNSRTKDQLDREIDYIGASLNATGYSLSLSCLTKHMDKGLTLMADVAMQANFPQTEFDRIKKQFESALISTKSDPNEMARNAMLSANFDGKPLGNIMTENSLQTISLNDIISYYRAIYTPKGSYLVVVGDINRAQTEKMVNQYFSSWNGGEPISNKTESKPFNTGNRVIFVKKPGAVQSVISVSFPIDMKRGDINQIPLTVMNDILGGGGFGARMMQNLREDKAYTYGCYSSVRINNNGSYFNAQGSFRNEVTDSAITQMLLELGKITEGFVTEDELKLMKSSMSGDFARSLEEPATIAGFAYNIIKNKLAKDYYQTYLKRLEAVSKEDVLNSAQGYIPVDKYTIVVVGNENVLDKIKLFDADGKIEMLDAFGKPAKEMKKAVLSKEQVIEKYLLATTQSSSLKAASKKIKKIKSTSEVATLTSSQIPLPLTSTRVWISPNMEGNKLEAQQMIFQKMYFDGKGGANWNMQTGATPLSTKEIETRQKQNGLFPEINFEKDGITYELLGVEETKDGDCNVITYTVGNKKYTEYYSVKSGLKLQTIILTDEDGEQLETTSNYASYTDVNGILFPHKYSVAIGPMSFNGEVTKFEVNTKINLDIFK